MDDVLCACGQAGGQWLPYQFNERIFTIERSIGAWIDKLRRRQRDARRGSSGGGWRFGWPFRRRRWRHIIGRRYLQCLPYLDGCRVFNVVVSG